MTTVYLDTETTGLDPRTDRLVAIGFAIDDSPVFTLRHDRDREVVQRVLALDATFAGHNVGFDLHFLEASGYQLPDPERWLDTQVVAHIAGSGGERLPGGTMLSNLTRRLIKAEILDSEILDPERELDRWLSTARTAATRAGRPRPEKGDAPDPLLVPYLTADVQCTRAVARHYGRRVNGQDSVLALERACAPAVWATERRGAPVDAAAAYEIQNASAVKLAALRTRAFELAGKQFPLRSALQIEEALAARDVDVAALPHTKTGKLAISKQALEGVDDELTRVLLAFMAEDKFHGTFIKLLHSINAGRVHTSFKQVGTITGRMASGHPNVQNLPASDLRARYVIAAAPGNVLVACDLSNVELRILACYAPGGRLEQALRDGIDLHEQVAGTLGISRDTAKAINYAMTYGGGARLISDKLGIERPVASALLSRYFSTYPEIRQLEDKLQRTVRQRGFLVSIGGRRHFYDRPDHTLINRLVSGGAADLFKLAVTRLHAASVPMILLVHDEVVAEVPEDQADATAALLEAELARGARRGSAVIDGLAAEAVVVERWSQVKDADWTPASAAVPV